MDSTPRRGELFLQNLRILPSKRLDTWTPLPFSDFFFFSASVSCLIQHKDIGIWALPSHLTFHVEKIDTELDSLILDLGL